jgi:ATP-dependent helicase/nuclease subunit A
VTGPDGRPSDWEQRERIRTELDRNLFVEAGAGTGKTTALVSRIVALVAAGRVKMAGLVAITFTEAAAAELRNRVRRELERAALDSQRPAEARAHCAVAAREVDLAAIQTIHSFAGTLLRTFPIEAGLPPGFEVWDEIRAGLAFEERFRSWLFDEVPTSEPTGQARRAAVRRALLLGVRADKLRDLARALQDQRDYLAPTTTWPTPDVTPPMALAHKVGQTLVDLVPRIRFARQPDSDPMGRQIRAHQAGAARLLATRSDDAALSALLALGPIKTTDGKQPNWDRDETGQNSLKGIKEILSEVKGELDAALTAYREAALAALLTHLRDFTLEFAAARQRAGAVTFHDLLVRARDLLRTSSTALIYARKRYTCLFVDEFQDTDPLQAEIVWRLAAASDPAVKTNWRALALQPGKLFVVGDPKQSIYRFRRADLGLYAEVSAGAALAERVALTQNFRSERSILEWVNYHFGRDMQHEAGIQAKYLDLEPADEHRGVGVHRLGGPLLANAETVRRAAAEEVARLIRSLEQRWLVRGEGGARRPAHFADICLLLPTRTGQRFLEEALAELDVPYRIESGSLVLDTPEVRDLLSCLRAIDDPSDQVALVAALRSPAYACSDVELLDWLERDGTLDYLAEPPADAAGPVAEAFRSLRSFHQRRLSRSVAATVEAFVNERLLAVGAFGQPRPREGWRRLRYVVSQARAFATTGRPTLRALLDWFDGLQRVQTRDVESPLPESDEDAVRILTVHGAKGLEFPIVILANLNSRPRASAALVLADLQSQQLEVAIDSLATAGYADASARENRLAEAERVRLLYVAATRARDHLVLCLHHKGKVAKPGGELKPDGQTHAGRICELLAEYPELSHPLADGSPPLLDRLPSADQPTAAPRRLVQTPDEQQEQERVWLARRAEQVAARRSARLITATELAQSGASVAAEPTWETLTDDEPADDVIAADRPATAAAVGRAVHATLAALAIGTSRTLVELAADLARSERVADRADDVARLAERLWNHPTVRSALLGGRCWPEVEVGAEIDGAVLEGRIDLLYEQPDGSFGLVDFKTDRADPAARAVREPAYRRQLGAYALAVQSVTGRPVSSAELLYATGPDELVSYTDLPALLAEARSAIGIASGS